MQPRYTLISKSPQRARRRMRAQPAAQPQRTTRSEVVRASGASRYKLSLGGRHRAGRVVEPPRGLEPEVLVQSALWTGTIAGGVRSPAVAATGRTVSGGASLSEGWAGNERNQRESSDKRFHDASLHVYGRRPWVTATAAGRRSVLAVMRQIGSPPLSDEFIFGFTL
jgi:hypothetical protein